MKYNKNKPRTIRQIPAVTKTKLWNKVTNCETTFQKKLAYSMWELKMTAFGTEQFLRNTKAIQENLNIYSSYMRVFFSGENLYWSLLCYDTTQSIW